ncbi:LPS export ABC transporter periplasmic protein LptC [Fulvivirga sediminis]|uniref:LPS export ABC transporter periplasmic protein LptC n=1 Tax=Fulvivirga sediminis TaxID=2803949 RepID=A0A937F5X0_9BACT|nr:LPS export ABC transporter periplasmic protein LptC [Fulvivirga sediminis]MBL3657017.1 LPS export ABC transporter periplasmic protein LptC [Fulvivirga sediminis]
MKHLLSIFFIISSLLLLSCRDSDKKVTDIKPYEGPIQEAEDLELFYNESATLKVKLITDRLLDFANGNREFPEGLYMEFYDEDGKLSSTLKANEAIYFKEENKWRGRGDVQLKNLENQQELNTEELFWKPDEEKMFTDKFVTIKLPDQTVYGTGLEAKQDFSEYQILKPEGIFSVDDNE